MFVLLLRQAIVQKPSGWGSCQSERTANHRTKTADPPHGQSHKRTELLLLLLQDVVQKPFARLTYTAAVELLLKAKVKFEFQVKWGSDLQSEHERYLTEQEFDGTPLFVTDYPKDIKVPQHVLPQLGSMTCTQIPLLLLMHKRSTLLHGTVALAP